MFSPSALDFVGHGVICMQDLWDFVSAVFKYNDILGKYNCSAADSDLVVFHAEIT